MEPFREICPMLSQAPCLQPRLSPSWCLADLPLGLAWLGHEIWKVNSQRSYQRVSGADDTELCSHLHLEVRREPWLSEQHAVPASRTGMPHSKKGAEAPSAFPGLSPVLCVRALGSQYATREELGCAVWFVVGCCLCNDCTDPISAVKLSVTLLPGPLS